MYKIILYIDILYKVPDYICQVAHFHLHQQENRELWSCLAHAATSRSSSRVTVNKTQLRSSLSQKSRSMENDEAVSGRRRRGMVWSHEKI